MAEGQATAASTPAESDAQAILDMLVPRAQARIDGQLRDNDALDAKALGFLGVDAAAIALMVAVRDALNEMWWIPTSALGCAAAILLAAVWPQRFDVGPDTRRFYETMGGSTRLAATRQMLSELLAAVDVNDQRILRKRLLFKAGFTVLVVSLIGALTVALVA
jgi:hypothetical protein